MPGTEDPHRYLDAATVAPPSPASVEAYLTALDEGWADPRRLHREGRRARLLLEGAREALADLLGARTEEVVLTTSHTRAVHAAVLGTRLAGRRRGGLAVASAVEHSAVLHALDHPIGSSTQGDAAGTAGVRVPVDRAGRVRVEAWAKAVTRPGVVLACLQHANGEVGTVQPSEEALPHARAARVPVLVDAGASLGHLPPPPVWDLLTADPRAWGSVPGLGLLAVREGVRWRSPDPAHEGTERTGDEPSVPAALAAAVALQEAEAVRRSGGDPRHHLVDLIRATAARIPDTEVVGDAVHRLPHVVTFSCLYADGEQLVERLDRAGFAVGSGSACTASTLEPSHVLAAMGVLTHGNVRVGLPRGTTGEEVEAFCAALPKAVAEVRALLGVDGL